MVELHHEVASAGEVWTICRWHECPHAALAAPGLPFDAATAAQWLREFRSHDLRRLAFDVLDPQQLSRPTDEQVVEQLAAMIVAGELRVIAGRLHDQASPPDVQQPSAAQKLLRRLRVTSHRFHFEAASFRIVEAGEWAHLRGSSDERYQVVPHDEAVPLLARIAASAGLSHDEAMALHEAVPLVPTRWRRDQPANTGILLIRIVDRSFNLESAGSAEVVTPSQMSGPKDPDHWIQITLIDDQDLPVPNQAYKVELPGGEIREGRLDGTGMAYIGGLKAGGPCKVCFPQIDTKEWRAV
ncbi:hypothetical protein HLB44_10475 [Aquincola sp. S2]|uniref:Uncharacterized protein n=1 Tax=Pseudaquabacterium terrae TaxID=2732868 RepID=A0ABX2EFK4_9BURK|nr:hypothetical protein [Aquabacterium terrae]NRF67409.1 hypothetical protein [Aquabacterium terrae]